jgi:hypothetical protein
LPDWLGKLSELLRGRRCRWLISLHKQSPIGRADVDFRVDMFNAFNHPIFQLPNGSMATANAGKVTDTAAPRQIMFGSVLLLTRSQTSPPKERR